MTYTEPLDVWQNLNGTNFLDLMYSDPRRWAMTFESLVTLTMLETHAANTLKQPDTWSPVKVGFSRIFLISSLLTVFCLQNIIF